MFTKLARCGRDPELRMLEDGTQVMNLALAYSYGRKGADGKKPTQWLDATMWGKQAEALHPHLHKGDAVVVSIDDLHTEEFESKGEKRHKLVGRIVSFDFMPKARTESQPQKESAPQPKPKPVGFSDFPDDIPF